jgi:hypothetical protein
MLLVSALADGGLQYMLNVIPSAQAEKCEPSNNSTLALPTHAYQSVRRPG